MNECLFPEIDQTLCIAECRKCVEACEENVLEKNEDDKLKIVSPENCTACENCVQACPVGAIWLD